MGYLDFAGAGPFCSSGLVVLINRLPTALDTPFLVDSRYNETACSAISSVVSVFPVLGVSDRASDWGQENLFLALEAVEHPCQDAAQAVCEDRSQSCQTPKFLYENQAMNSSPRSSVVNATIEEPRVIFE